MARAFEPKTLILGLKIVFKYLKPYKRDFIALSIFGLILAAANAFVPLLAGRIFDSIIAISRDKTAAVTVVFNTLIL